MTVTVDNIGLFETSKGDTLDNSIVITVVNMEEESTLKNQPAIRRRFHCVQRPIVIRRSVKHLCAVYLQLPWGMITLCATAVVVCHKIPQWSHSIFRRTHKRKYGRATLHDGNDEAFL